MARVSIITCLLIMTLFAGCAGLVTEKPTETTDESSPTTTQTRTPHQCDTFGTGGIAPLAETNNTVSTVGQANRTLHTVISEHPDYPFNASDFEYVPQDEIDDKRAVRDELDMRSTDTTLYYFSPHDYTKLDDMVIVSENGSIFAVIIGAC
jgi:hypothetical protein